MDIKEILAKCDHTLLKQESTWEDIKGILDDAKKYHTASVCIPPCYIKRAKEYTGDEVKLCTVIGFPNGSHTTECKVFETKDAVANGADEVDMVINIGAAKDGKWDLVESDIRSVVSAANGYALVKVIIETCLLTDEEKVKACEAAMRAGADFVKTSTGFSTGGANAHDVALMRSVVGDKLGVKASGGIRTPEDAEAMIAAGANRIGASNGIKLLG